MAQHYLNVLTVRLRGYDGHPLPQNLTGETAAEITVGALVDLEQLAAEITEDLGGGPRRVRQSLTETSWGASGSGAELIIDVPAMISGAASLVVLWDVVWGRILHHGRPRILRAETQAECARAWLAESLNIGVDAIQITALEPAGDGHRVDLETPGGLFTVETDSSGVTRMQRTSSG